MSQSFPYLESCILTFDRAELQNVCYRLENTSAKENSKEQENSNR